MVKKAPSIRRKRSTKPPHGEEVAKRPPYDFSEGKRRAPTLVLPRAPMPLTNLVYAPEDTCSLHVSSIKL